MKNKINLTFVLILLIVLNAKASSIDLYNNIKIDNQSSSKAVNYAIKALQTGQAESTKAHPAVAYYQEKFGDPKKPEPLKT